MSDAWDPSQYERFRDERRQPARDLIALVEKKPGMRVVDLGCGTGGPTLELHRELAAAETTGVDASPAMLRSAPSAAGLRFVEKRIEDFAPEGPVDLVFSNSALHFVADHERLLARFASWLAPAGQLAVQVPMNDDHVSHTAAFELAREHEWKRLLGGYERRPLLPEPVRYVAWLRQLGFARQLVRLQIYAHLLESREAVVEWVRGALLTDYEKRLPPDDYARFLRRYRDRLIPQLPDDQPFLYPYPRLFVWARLPD